MLRYYICRAPNVSPLITSENPHSLAVIQPLRSFFPLGTPLTLHTAMLAEVPTKQKCLMLWTSANLLLKTIHSKMYQEVCFNVQEVLLQQMMQTNIPNPTPDQKNKINSAPWMKTVQNCLLVQVTVVASWHKPSLPYNTLTWFMSLLYYIPASNCSF